MHHNFTQSVPLDKLTPHLSRHQLFSGWAFQHRHHVPLIWFGGQERRPVPRRVWQSAVESGRGDSCLIGAPEDHLSVHLSPKSTTAKRHDKQDPWDRSYPALLTPLLEAQYIFSLLSTTCTNRHVKTQPNESAKWANPCPCGERRPDTSFLPISWRLLHKGLIDPESL